MTTHRLLAKLLLGLLLAPVLGHALFSLAPGMASLVVTSGSMSPAISAGSVVYVADTDSYREGDVITFKHEGVVITHRIVEETTEGYRTKGDANDDADGWTVTQDQILGEVLLAIPMYGYLLTFASSRLGILLFVFLPGAGLVYLTLRDMRMRQEPE